MKKIEIKLSVEDTKYLLTSMEDISEVLRTSIISIKQHLCIPDTIRISIHDSNKINKGWIGYYIDDRTYIKKLTMTETPSQILASLIVDATYEIRRIYEDEIRRIYENI